MAEQKTSVNRSVASAYSNKYISFSGHDMVCVFEIPITGKTISKVVGSLQTVTYSVHQEKTPVRCIGDMNAKGYVFGPRTIAGTLIFTVFNKHWAQDMMEEYLDAYKINAHFLVDELPPINITISFANEYGNKARLALYGVTFINEGQVMSINDLYTENTFQFFATDIDYLSNIASSTSGKPNHSNSDLPDVPSSNDSSSSSTTENNTSTNDADNDNNKKPYFYDIRNTVTEYIQFTSKIPEAKANELLKKLFSDRTNYINEVNKLYSDKKITEAEKQTQLNKINSDYRLIKNIINNNTKKEGDTTN